MIIKHNSLMNKIMIKTDMVIWKRNKNVVGGKTIDDFANII